jgi:hypothetical protein
MLTTIPSVDINPMRSCFVWASFSSEYRQAMGWTVLSYFHGCMEMIARVKYVRSFNVRAIGLKTLATPSWPAMLVLTPALGQRPVLHRKE